MRTRLLASVVALIIAAPALAEDAMFVPLFTYRTGPFGGSGTPSADGQRDYMVMLNERDGGIGGAKLTLQECEFGYDTKRGIECYDSVKSKAPLLVNPWSTGVALSIIPHAALDKIPIMTMAHGLSATANGEAFPWIFNPPATYWDGMSEILQVLGEGKLDNLKGKKIGYLYLDAGFGKEPLPLLDALAREFGFETKLYPVALADMQNQDSKWLDIRRDKPDFLIIYGYGAMNPTAMKQLAKSNYPADRVVSIWWANETDMLGAGEAVKGVREVMWHAPGADFPAFKDIQKYVIDAGKSQTPAGEMGQTLYNHGVMSAVLIAEAIVNAQKLTGKKIVTGEDVRRGMERINLDAERQKALGLEGFTQPFKLTCADHNAHLPVVVQRWDGAKFETVSGPVAPALDRVKPLLDAAVKAYVEKNAWPARTEPCDAG